MEHCILFHVKALTDVSPYVSNNGILFFPKGKAWKFASDTDLQPCALMMSFNMAQCEGEGRESVRIRYVMGCYFLGFISSDSFGLLLKKKKKVCCHVCTTAILKVELVNVAYMRHLVLKASTINEGQETIQLQCFDN